MTKDNDPVTIAARSTSQVPSQVPVIPPNRPSIAVTTGLLRGYYPVRGGPSRLEDWQAPIALLAGLGASGIDFGELWGPLHDYSTAELKVIAEFLAAQNVSAAGISLLGLDFTTGGNAGPDIDRVKRAITQAALLGAGNVSLGLHPKSTSPIAPSDIPPYPVTSGEAVANIVDRLAHLASVAAAESVSLSLETHESSVLYCSANLLRILDEVGASNLFANPDLGNLLRAPAPIAEEPLETILALAGRIKYWHVKSAVRLEVGRDTYRSFPSTMIAGSIDYRAMLNIAVAAGFDGHLVIEHYGGDTLTNAAHDVAYLRALLDDPATYVAW
jgi:sugar phosphate isomerase/epimerase